MSNHNGNPQRKMANYQEAFTLSLDGETVRGIGRIMGLKRTGANAGQPYSPGTVHGWLTRGTLELAPICEELAERHKRIALARYESLYLALADRRKDAHVPAIVASRGIVDRICVLLGLDAPSEFLIGARAGEMTSAALLIVKRVVQDMLPEEQAGEMLAAMEEQICEYNGEPQAVEVKVRQLRGQDDTSGAAARP